MKIPMRLLQNIIKLQEINTIYIFRNFSTKAIEFIDHATDMPPMQFISQAQKQTKLLTLVHWVWRHIDRCVFS